MIPFQYNIKVVLYRIPPFQSMNDTYACVLVLVLKRWWRGGWPRSKKGWMKLDGDAFLCPDFDHLQIRAITQVRIRYLARLILETAIALVPESKWQALLLLLPFYIDILSEIIVILPQWHLRVGDGLGWPRQETVGEVGLRCQDIRHCKSGRTHISLTPHRVCN